MIPEGHPLGSSPPGLIPKGPLGDLKAPPPEPDTAPPRSSARAGADVRGGRLCMASPGRARVGCVQAEGTASAPRQPGRLGAPRRLGLWLPTSTAWYRLPAAGQRSWRPGSRAPRPRSPRPCPALEAALGPAAAAAAAGGACRGLPRPEASDTEPWA
jgi:hypothetical protein